VEFLLHVHLYVQLSQTSQLVQLKQVLCSILFIRYRFTSRASEPDSHQPIADCPWDSDTKNEDSPIKNRVWSIVKPDTKGQEH
jgi:hypothetical protein